MDFHNRIGIGLFIKNADKSTLFEKSGVPCRSIHKHLLTLNGVHKRQTLTKYLVQEVRFIATNKEPMNLYPTIFIQQKFVRYHFG